MTEDKIPQLLFALILSPTLIGFGIHLVNYDRPLDGLERTIAMVCFWAGIGCFLPCTSFGTEARAIFLFVLFVVVCCAFKSYRRWFIRTHVMKPGIDDFGRFLG